MIFSSDLQYILLLSTVFHLAVSESWVMANLSGSAFICIWLDMLRGT